MNKRTTLLIPLAIVIIIASLSFCKKKPTDTESIELIQPFADSSNTDNDMYAKDKIRFEIENIERAKEALAEMKIEDILQSLAFDKEKPHRNVSPTDVNFECKVLAHSNDASSLVYRANHAFFDGMYQAYADHRPFVLSPDMLWLLITQGFAQHVNNNAEELRDMLVNFDKQTTLIYTQEGMNEHVWENFAAGFTQQIASQINPEFTDALTCNFSTSTPTTLMASQITIMEATKPYFRFMGAMVVCGIPEVTLEGTPEDWQKLLDKTLYLKKYKLDWWIDELEPILKELVKTSEGTIDKQFWMKMFKIHSAEICGDPGKVDGWIVKFFPYYKDGERTGLTMIPRNAELPSEVVKVDMRYVIIGGGQKTEKMVELYAGFFGLRQDNKTLALKPEIGWMVREKDNSDLTLKALEQDNKEGGIVISTREIPMQLLSMKKIKSLTVFFTDRITIPDEMRKLKIKEMSLYGITTEQEAKEIRSMFPNTTININGDIQK